MNAGPDVERLLSDWLVEEAPARAPDRLLLVASDRLDHTGQRARWRYWRLPVMNTPLRVGTAAVVGLLLIGAGIYLFGGGGPGIGSAPTPTSNASPTAPPDATPAPSPANLKPGALCLVGSCQSGALDPGTYSFEAGTVTPARLTFTVPAGWATSNGFVSKHAEAPGEVQFSTWAVSHIFADVCDDNAGLVEVGTADEIASAFAAQQGPLASAVTDATVGGFPAKRIELTLPVDLHGGDCRPRFFPGAGPDLNSGYCCMALGSTETVYAVDVAGERFVLVARHQPGSAATDVAELQAILDSIELDAPAASPSPAAASPTASASVAAAYEAVFLRSKVVEGSTEVRVIGVDRTGKEREIALLPGAWTAHRVSGGPLAARGAVSTSGLLAMASNRGASVETVPSMHWEIFDLQRTGVPPIVIAGVDGDDGDFDSMVRKPHFFFDSRPGPRWLPGERLAVPGYNCDETSCGIWSYFDGRTGNRLQGRPSTPPDCRTRDRSGAEFRVRDGAVVRQDPDGSDMTLASPGGTAFACLAPDDSMIVHEVADGDPFAPVSGMIDPQSLATFQVDGNFAGFLEVAP